MNTIKMIQDLFTCEPVDEDQEQASRHTSAVAMEEELIPDRVLATFLDERETLRVQMHHDLSISSYLRCHDKLIRYGLDEYFMELLKWEINLKMGGDPDTFFSPDFELSFKDHKELLDLAESLNKVQQK